MLENVWANAIYSLTPTVLIGLVFWYILRTIIRSDRRERTVYARMEAEERARLGLPPKKTATTEG